MTGADGGSVPASPPAGPWFTGPEGDWFRYRIDDLDQGRSGGQGIVYPACDKNGTLVALKLLSDPDLDFDRVLALAPALRRVTHPNLAQQVDVFMGTALCAGDAVRGGNGYPFDVAYTVCDWVEGVDLTEAVAGATPARLIGWVADVAGAVAHLHSDATAPGGVVHRDVKPGNVRVTAEDRAVLVDYGCARHVDGTPMTQGMGTPGWRAPEVLLAPGRVGPAADAWGVAALAYWSFTGEAPQLGSVPEHRERLEVAARRAGARDPVRLAATTAALLATEPGGRPKDLMRWADSIVATERGRRSSQLAAVSVALVVVLVVLTVHFLRPTPRLTAEPALGTGVTNPVGTTTSVLASSPVLDAATTDGAAGATLGFPVIITGPVSSTTAPAATITAIVPNSGGAAGNGAATTIATPGGSTGTTTTTVVGPANRSVTPTPATFPETTGGETHTWTNYSNAGGSPGEVMAAGTTIQISCKVQGFKVPDGNTWWYRIASSPWNNTFYASADAFYNNGQTSGPLRDTPFVDPLVPDC